MNTYDHFRHSVPITHTHSYANTAYVSILYESQENVLVFTFFVCVSFLFSFFVFPLYFSSFFIIFPFSVQWCSEANEEKYYTCKHNRYVELGLFLSTDAVSRCFIIIDFLCITRYAVSFIERTK